VTEQNNPPFGQAPEQPPAAPLPPQQAFGDAPTPPAAEGSFGAAPAAVPPPTAGEAFGVAPAPEKKKSNVLKIIGSIVVVLVVLCLAGGFFAYRSLTSDPTKDAKAGDCIDKPVASSSGDSVSAKIVACTSTDAAYKVVGRVNDKTEAESGNDSNVCAAFPEVETWYVAIPKGGKGYVLCLTEVSK